MNEGQLPAAFPAPTHPAISFVPAGVMFTTILALNVIGDALRRASDLRDTAL
jgi:ABC-type dipeptide/oligopeptide/nickel transport system permease subunit